MKNCYGIKIYHGFIVIFFHFFNALLLHNPLEQLQVQNEVKSICIYLYFLYRLFLSNFTSINRTV